MSSQYVRIKREQKTFFFECFPHDSVESLKILLKNFFDKVELVDMRLYIGDRVDFNYFLCFKVKIF